jgi:pimeloyl-ACP methyl ester carboxylesterase
VTVLREREFRADVAGGQIVGWRGDESGPPALLLHGGPGLSDYLDSLAMELAGVVTTARYQQRGLAPSLVEGPREVDTHVADAIAVLDALGWDRAWVVGHSWGGHLAMHVAVSHSERLLGLVVLDGLGAVGDGGISALGPNLTAALTEAERARVEWLDARDDRGEASEAEKLEQLRMVWPYYFADPANAPPMPQFRTDTSAIATWASIAEHVERRTLELGLPRLTMPTLIMQGQRSPLPIVEAQRTAALMPHAKLAIHRRGHFPWLEEPGLVHGLIAEFVMAPSSSG